MDTYTDYVCNVLLNRSGAVTFDRTTIRLDFWHPTNRDARWPVFTCSVPAEPTAEQREAFEQAVAAAKRDIDQMS